MMSTETDPSGADPTESTSSESADDASPTTYETSNNAGGLSRLRMRTILGTLAGLAMSGGLLYGGWALAQEHDSAASLYVMGGLAAVFLLVTIWIGVSGWKQVRRREERARRLREAPGRPWTVRDDWAEGVVDAEGRDEGVCVLSDVPGVLGETLSVRVEADDLDLSDAVRRGQEPVLVSLSCRYRRNRDDRASTSWREEREIAVQSRGNRAVIPVSFDLPDAAASATPDPEGLPRVDWLLRVHDDGWDGPVTFKLPVFKQTGIAPQPLSADVPGTRDLSAQATDARDSEREYQLGSRPDPKTTAGTTENEEARRDADRWNVDASDVRRLDGVSVEERGGTARVAFDTHATEFASGRGCSWVLIAGLVGLHGIMGYMNAVVAAPLALHVGPHVLVGVFTAYFIYNALRAARMTVHVEGGEDRVRAHLAGFRETLLFETEPSNVNAVEAVIADPKNPDRGYTVCVHLHDRISRDAASKAMGQLGSAIGAYRPETGQHDPRSSPTLPLLLPDAESARTVAAYLEARIPTSR